ncbi:uncharacterized protein EI97DRAFT_468077, partial [Westerdykella ornata]
GTSRRNPPSLTFLRRAWSKLVPVLLAIIVAVLVAALHSSTQRLTPRSLDLIPTLRSPTHSR